MDNFEYSIQISDRDWEEFYSTAEECGLIPVALATEEEPLLSDTEEAACSMTSSKPKFIRVSLCPKEEEPPPTQVTQSVTSPPIQASYRWVDPSEDVLSGSEDEDIGSVTRFLCQKENLLHKKEVQQRTDIPFLKQSKDQHPVNLNIDNTVHSSKSESLVEYMRGMNRDRRCHFEIDIENHMAKTPTERRNHTMTFNGVKDSRYSNNGRANSVEADIQSSADKELLSPNNQGCVKGEYHQENIPGINTNSNMTTNITKLCPSQNANSFPASIGQNHHLDLENENDQPQRIAQTRDAPGKPLSSKYNGFPLCKTLDNVDNTLDVIPQESGLQGATVIDNSSAVQQNSHSTIDEFLALQCSEFSVCIATNTVTTAETIIDPDRVPVADHMSPTYNVDPLGVVEHFEADHVSPTYNNLAPLGVAEHFEAEYTTPTYSMESVSDAGQTLQTRSRPKPIASFSSRNTVLTLPEMYDFFLDDFSDIGMTEPETNTTSTDRIMYTPDMYEYFFVEDKAEHGTIKSKDNKTKAESSSDLAVASTPSAAASWPEAYEFFFTDGPEDGEKKGILFSMPPHQAQSVAGILQSSTPGGLKALMVQGASHRQNTDRSHGIHEETNVATGSLAPYISPSRSDACLVFLAFASWAVKSSDMQSSDGWKTALLANIGAISAIGYLRRRYRRAWQESVPQPGEET